MIREDELYEVGKVLKSHGTKGEMLLSFKHLSPDVAAACGYIICPMDGILVPFFLKSFSARTEESARVQLKGVETSEQAKCFINKFFYLPKEACGEDAPEKLETIKGYSVEDLHYGHLGTVEAIDDSTENILLIVVDAAGRETLIPAQESWIVEWDDQERRIVMNLPEGLTDPARLAEEA